MIVKLGVLLKYCAPQRKAKICRWDCLYVHTYRGFTYSMIIQIFHKSCVYSTQSRTDAPTKSFGGQRTNKGQNQQLWSDTVFRLTTLRVGNFSGKNSKQNKTEQINQQTWRIKLMFVSYILFISKIRTFRDLAEGTSPLT